MLQGKKTEKDKDKKGKKTAKKDNKDKDKDEDKDPQVRPHVSHPHLHPRIRGPAEDVERGCTEGAGPQTLAYGGSHRMTCLGQGPPRPTSLYISDIRGSLPPPESVRELGGVPHRLSEYAAWYFQVYAHVHLLRRASSTRGCGLVVRPLGWGVKGAGSKRARGGARS